MDVNIGKGITLSVPDNMPANVEAHARYIGYRNILMDAHASATRDEHGDQVNEVAQAMAEKKLAALVAGELRVAGTRSRETDPVRAEAIKIAADRLKVALRAKGKAVKDFEPAVLKKKYEEMLVKYPDILELAKKRVEENKGAEVDLTDIV